MHPLESISISSVVVNAKPGRVDQVIAGLNTLPGVEVHVVTEEGKLIVTIESESDKSVANTFEAINQQPGVLSASMVYHQYETNPDEEV